MHSPSIFVVARASLAVLALISLAGCESSKKGDAAAGAGQASTNVETSEKGTAGNEATGAAAATEQPVGEPKEFEVDAAGLLSGALPEADLQQGWVSLFDGQSLFGWFIFGKANWRVEEGVIKVDRGEKSFLCTNLKLADYELSVDFRGDAKTNSGVFLRTILEPQDVTMDCIELNIAPPENPFPTASLVQRKKVEPADLGSFDPTKWHTFLIRLEGDQVKVSLDGKPVLEYTDDSGLGKGHISLQHNEGRSRVQECAPSAA